MSEEESDGALVPAGSIPEVSWSRKSLDSEGVAARSLGLALPDRVLLGSVGPRSEIRIFFLVMQGIYLDVALCLQQWKEEQSRG